MKKQLPSPLLRPYAFILKEGSGIRQDMLDYKLLLLDLRCAEVITSPDGTDDAQASKTAGQQNTRQLIAQMEALVRQLEGSGSLEEANDPIPSSEL